MLVSMLLQTVIEVIY